MVCLAALGAGSVAAETTVRPIPRPASAPAGETAGLGPLRSVLPRTRERSDPGEHRDGLASAPDIASPLDPSPARSVRPRTRGADGPESTASAGPTGLAPARSAAPAPRPDLALGSRPGSSVTTAKPASTARPGILNAIFGPKAGSGAKPSRAGSVCGDPAIKGTELPAIKSVTGGCGIASPVRVTEVASVRLSPPATLNCDATRTLETWIERSLKPAFRGETVTGVRVFASYACRGRNNVRGARISEHAKGNAIDIGSVTTAERGEYTVLDDFKRGRGAPLRRAYKGACGIFGTTLGPGSDGYHENHMHFDIAHYRNGAYCR